MKRKANVLRSGVIAGLLSLGVYKPVSGATLYWDNTTNTNFNDATQWSEASGATTPNPSAAPGAADIAFFNITGGNANQTINVTAAINVAGMVFNSTGTTTLSQTANRLTTIGSSGLVLNAGSGAVTLGQSTNSLGVTTGVSQAWQNDSANTLTIRNVMNNAAGLTATLTLTGSGTGTSYTFSNAINENSTTPGTLSLVVDMSGTGVVSLSSAASTYAGGTTIRRGSVTAAGTQALGTGDVLIGDTSGTGNATLTLNAAGIFANNMTVQAGSSGTATIRNTSTSNVPVIGGALTLNKDTVFDVVTNGTTSVITTILGTGNISLLNGGTLSLGTGGTTGALASGTTVSGTGLLGFNRSDNVVLSNNTTGTVGISQLGSGTLTLTGVAGGIHAGTGATRLSNGTLALDFTNAVSPTNLISSTSALTLGATTARSNLVVQGASGVANTQTFASTTFNSDTTITLTAGDTGGTVQLNLGTLTRNAGTYVNLAPGAGTTITALTGVNGAIWTQNNIAIGSFGNDWAARASVGNEIVPASTIGGFYSNSTATALAGNANISSGVDTVLAANTSIASVRFIQNEARTLDLNGNILTLTSGGLLIGSTVGTAGSKIIGGTLRGAPGGTRELTVIQHSSLPFEIGSNITDSGGTSVFSKHGNGTLILTGTNSWTGASFLNAGTLQIGNGGTTGNIGGTASFTNLGVLAINRSDSLSIANLISGSGSVQILSGTATFSASNTYSGGLTIKNGTAQGATSSSAFGTGAITLGDSAGGSNNASLIQTTTGLNIATPIVLAANTTGTLTIGNTAAGIATTTFSGAITGVNNLTLANQGTGSFALAMTGNINNAGAVNTVGTSTGVTTLTGGLGSNVTHFTHGASGGLTIGTSALANSGNLTFSGTGAGAVTISSAINTSGAIVNNGTTTGLTTLSGAIGAGVTSITQNSSTSTLHLSGTNTNYAGPTSLVTGTLRLTSATALGGNGSTTGTGGSLNIAAGTNLENNSGSPVTMTTVNAININGSFTFFSPNSISFSTGAVTLGAPNISISSNGAGGFNSAGAIGGTSNITFSAGSTGGYAMSGLANFSGSVTNNGGGTGALSFSGGVTSNVTDITHMSNGNMTLSSTSVANNGDILFAGTGAGTVTFSATTINTTGLITNAGTTTGTTTISGQMTANVDGVVQNSPTSLLTLSGAQSNFAGGVTVKAGSVFLQGSGGNNNPLGSGQAVLGDTSGSANATISHDQTGAINTALLIQSGNAGVLTLRNNNTSGNPNYNGAITMNNNFTIETNATQNAAYAIGGGFTSTVGSGHVLTLKNNSTLSTSAITVQTGAVNFAGSILNAGTGTRPVTISAAIGANVTGITQNSTGSSLTLSGNNGSFAGDITVSAGTLTASAANSLNANVLVSIASGATLNLTSGVTNAIYNVEGLTGAGQVLLSSAANRTLAVNGTSGTNELSGALNIGGATQNLSKSGGSTQIFSGTLAHSGTTAINGGTLIINGTHSNTTVGAYSVNNGGTLGGSGTINTTGSSGVAVVAGGKLSPGGVTNTLTMNLGATGVLNLSGAVTANNTQSLIFELTTPAGSDKIAVTNSGAATAVNIGTGVLEFNDFAFFVNGVIDNGDYTLIDSNAAFTGTLGANLTGALNVHQDGTLSLANGGQDLVLTVVPEPGSLSILAMGAAGLLRRRRRRA